MRIAIVTALWQRPELTRIFLRHYAEMEVPGVELCLIAAVSPHEDPALRTAFDEGAITYDGWATVAVDNKPLSDKWAATLLVARRRDIDAILIMGSDDFVDAKYIQRIAAELEDHALIISQSIYFYSTERREMFYATQSRVGPGRALRRDLLNECDWKPWELGVNSNLEGAMNRKLGSRPFRKIIGEDLTILDVKTGENMWSYDHVSMLRRKDVDPEAFLRERFPGVADELLALDAHE